MSRAREESAIIVLCDAERIGSRHVEEVFVKELVVKRGLWRCNSRLKRTTIANSRGTTEKAKLIVMQCQHVLD